MHDKISPRSTISVCSAIEEVRLSTPIAYRMLQKLIEFAIHKGNDESAASALSKLMERPMYSLAVFAADTLLFLMKNYSKIFFNPNEEDVPNSKCQPENVRKKLRMERKSKIECKQQ